MSMPWYVFKPTEYEMSTVLSLWNLTRIITKESWNTQTTKHINQWCTGMLSVFNFARNPHFVWLRILVTIRILPWRHPRSVNSESFMWKVLINWLIRNKRQIQMLLRGLTIKVRRSPKVYPQSIAIPLKHQRFTQCIKIIETHYVRRWHKYNYFSQEETSTKWLILSIKI
jgi:hypothetical protein